MLATKSNTYTFQKNGIWYFSRRVPADLRRHYKTGRIAYSLDQNIKQKIRRIRSAIKVQLSDWSQDLCFQIALFDKRVL